MSEGITCYERDEALCDDPMCARVGCKIRNEALSKVPLTAEQFAEILWPGMFYPGWRDQDPTSAFYQSALYCLQKSAKILEKIEVRRK